MLHEVKLGCSCACVECPRLPFQLDTQQEEVSLLLMLFLFFSFAIICQIDQQMYSRKSVWRCVFPQHLLPPPLDLFRCLVRYCCRDKRGGGAGKPISLRRTRLPSRHATLHPSYLFLTKKGIITSHGGDPRVSQRRGRTFLDGSLIRQRSRSKCIANGNKSTS